METNARKETKTTETRTNRHRMGQGVRGARERGEGVKARQQNDTRNVNVTINNGAYTQQQKQAKLSKSQQLQNFNSNSEILTHFQARTAIPCRQRESIEREKERERVVQTTGGIQMRLFIETGQDYRADYVQMCWRMRVGKLKICEQGVFGQSTRN